MQSESSDVTVYRAQTGARLEDVTPGALVDGITPQGTVTIKTADWSGTNTLSVIYADDAGRLGEAVLYREKEAALRLVDPSSVFAFTADSDLFRLAAEAYRIQMAGEFDPMIAVTTSDLEALPHQLRAVYETMLDRRPLRFLLADDPGAGKTIMAGLLIKELMLRGDVERCIVVAPGGLVDQWQDELYSKFGLDFHILTRADIATAVDGNPFTRNPLVIARMDFMARNDELIEHVESVDWDLAIVDEAHRMSASYFGNELKRTKRYLLGQHLSQSAKHFLLMTATPHSGNPENFQLFLALLDGDRFEGRFRDGVHSSDTSDLMRRMVKEDLLTFEGKPLFPDRTAETISYHLTPDERSLYENVTAYVREEMGRVQRMKAEGEGKRGNMIGFALTVLQRRLASSPEAIYKSLERRRKRLESERHAVATGGSGDSDFARRLRTLYGTDKFDDDNLDDLDGGDAEDFETEVATGLTTAKTVEEYDKEIEILGMLERQARDLRNSGVDVKWTELRNVLEDSPYARDGDERRKIIVFTEHKDTLEYLVERIRTLLGSDDAVVAIHGGVSRENRRAIQERFTTDKDVVVLVATDAAGEGLNLQQAHLMVNYDLPWNPNRLEQRFGRIHRIGQKEVCRLWNLLADDTREGEVYKRLLDKIEEQRKAYDGKLFDVLGDVFRESQLKDLMLEAIIEGDDPEVRARLDRVIDATVSEGIDRLIAERQMHGTQMTSGDVMEARRLIEEAKARKLQPGYIESFFTEAFGRYGGQMLKREDGRFEINQVPQRMHEADRPRGLGAPLQPKYERVCFDRAFIQPDGLSRASLIAPGHPLLDSLIAVVLHDHRSLLKEGAILVDDDDPLEDPHVVVALFEEVRAGNELVLARRFGFVRVDEHGTVEDGGHAPWTDCRAPTDAEREIVADTLQAAWLKRRVEQDVVAWATSHDMQPWVRDWETRQTERGERETKLVRDRLLEEINHWDQKAAELAELRANGKKIKIAPETAEARARELELRMQRRLAEIAEASTVQALPPRVAGAAFVVPIGLLERVRGERGEDPATYARNTREVEDRAVEAVVAAERALGRDPEVKARNHKGFDISSQAPDGTTVIIEVKGRIAGAKTFIITRSEVNAGLEAEDYRLALVSVSPNGPQDDEVRYCLDPFKDVDIERFRGGSFTTATLEGNWVELWEQGVAPV